MNVLDVLPIGKPCALEVVYPRASHLVIGILDAVDRKPDGRSSRIMLSSVTSWEGAIVVHSPVLVVPAMYARRAWIAPVVPDPDVLTPLGHPVWEKET